MTFISESIVCAPNSSFIKYNFHNKLVYSQNFIALKINHPTAQPAIDTTDLAHMMERERVADEVLPLMSPSPVDRA